MTGLPNRWELDFALRAARSETSEWRACAAIEALGRYFADDPRAVEALAVVLEGGRTAELRMTAARSLAMSLSPGAFDVLEKAAPRLSGDIANFVDGVLGIPSRERGMSQLAERGTKAHEGLFLKDAEAAEKVRDKLTAKLSKEGVGAGSSDCLVTHEPDLAQGGVGFRLDVVPTRPEAAGMSIWCGSHSIRCAILPLEVGKTFEWVVPWGRLINVRNAVLLVQAVTAGRVEAFISPDGTEAVARVTQTPWLKDDLKSSSDAPDVAVASETWRRVSYEAYSA